MAQLKESFSNAVSEVTYQFVARPTDAPAVASADEMKLKQRFGPNARILSAPSPTDASEKSYFADLPGELQHVLQVQLRHDGDISAVIETPGVFRLYVLQARTNESISVAALSLPKRNFQAWLSAQSD